MKKIALIGAGGKMGMRCTNNLMTEKYETFYVEINPEAAKRIEEKGLKVSSAEEAVPVSDIVILAVPDIALKAVSNSIVPQMKAGAMVICLDPAAPLAGHIYHRDDLAYYVTHPAHPSVFNWEETREAQRDYYGGISAKQPAVSAIMHGSDDDYKIGDEVTKAIYKPITVNHRITVKQMAILEPAFSETMTSTCIKKMRDALDIVVEKGVPFDAARDFILGHINIQLAVLFNELPIKFSDAALKALDRAENILFKDDWHKIFDDDDIMTQIDAITK